MAINFPTPTTVGETYTDPTSGSTFVCVALGPPAQWVGSGSSTSLDNTYLRKDGSNDPVTGQLEITPSTDTTGLVVTQPSGNTAAAMRITNEGSGDSLVIEDSANPDSSPTVIDSSGRLLIGTSSGSGNPYLKVQGTTANANAGAIVTIARGNNPAAASNALGTLSFRQGATEEIGAEITAESDAAWTASSSLPTRLTFSAVPSGSTTLTERMRVTEYGGVRLGRDGSTDFGVFSGAAGFYPLEVNSTLSANDSGNFAGAYSYHGFVANTGGFANGGDNDSGVSVRYEIGQSTTQSYPVSLFITVSACNTSSGSPAAVGAWFLYNLVTFNGNLNAVNLKDSGGDTGTISISLAGLSTYTLGSYSFISFRVTTASGRQETAMSVIINARNAIVRQERQS